MIFFFKTPLDITKLLPVKSSAPAKTTRLSAIPKETPITILVYGAPFSRPPSTLINKFPKPMYIPASALSSR